MRDYVISLNRACLSDSPSPSLDILVSFTYPCRPTQFSSSLPHPVCPLSTVPSLLITYHPPLDSLLLLLSFIVIFQFGRIWRLYFTLISSFLAQAMFLWVSPKHSFISITDIFVSNISFFSVLSFFFFVHVLRLFSQIICFFFFSWTLNIFILLKFLVWWVQHLCYIRVGFQYVLCCFFCHALKSLVNAGLVIFGQ